MCEAFGLSPCGTDQSGSPQGPPWHVGRLGAKGETLEPRAVSSALRREWQLRDGWALLQFKVWTQGQEEESAEATKTASVHSLPPLPSSPCFKPPWPGRIPALLIACDTLFTPPQPLQLALILSFLLLWGVRGGGAGVGLGPTAALVPPTAQPRKWWFQRCLKQSRTFLWGSADVKSS